MTPCGGKELLTIYDSAVSRLSLCKWEFKIEQQRAVQHIISEKYRFQ
jgi:hypothetical protein